MIKKGDLHRNMVVRCKSFNFDFLPSYSIEIYQKKDYQLLRADITKKRLLNNTSTLKLYVTE
ncbi:hypothetical protein MXB_1068, partial [Myxobolus squamalis]